MMWSSWGLTGYPHKRPKAPPTSWATNVNYVVREFRFSTVINFPGGNKKRKADPSILTSSAWRELCAGDRY